MKKKSLIHEYYRLKEMDPNRLQLRLKNGRVLRVLGLDFYPDRLIIHYTESLQTTYQQVESIQLNGGAPMIVEGTEER